MLLPSINELCYRTIYLPMVVCLRCLLHHILWLIAMHFEETGILFSLLLRSLWWVEIIGYVLDCSLYSFACTLPHFIINTAQTYPKIYFVECVSKIKHIISVSIIHIWGCVFPVHPFPCWWFREYIPCLVIILYHLVRVQVSTSNRAVYNDRFSLVSVSVRVKLHWLQLERSENQQPIPGPRMRL